jgi:hypothetical protein
MVRRFNRQELDMNSASRLWSASRRVVVVVAVLLTLCIGAADQAWAKGKKAKEEEPAATGKSYVMPYGLVLMGVTLGLMAVCRPGRRADEPAKQENK